MFSVCLTYVCSILFSVVSLYLFHHVFSCCLCLFHHVFSCFFFPPPYVCSIMFVVCLPMFVPSWFQFFPDVCSIMCLFPYVCSIMFSFFCPMFVPSCCQFFFPYVCSIMFSYVFSLRLFHHVFFPPMFVPSCFQFFPYVCSIMFSFVFAMCVPSCYHLFPYVCSIMFSVVFLCLFHHVFSLFPYVCPSCFQCFCSLCLFHHVFLPTLVPSCFQLFPCFSLCLLNDFGWMAISWISMAPAFARSFRTSPSSMRRCGMARRLIWRTRCFTLGGWDFLGKKMCFFLFICFFNRISIGFGHEQMEFNRILVGFHHQTVGFGMVWNRIDSSMFKGYLGTFWEF